MRLRSGLAAALFLLVTAPASAQPLRSATVSAANYPADVRPGAEPLRVEIRYQLAPDGSVSGCDVTRSSGRPSIDAESCRILRERARFRPEPGAMRGRIRFDWLGEASLATGNPAGAPIALSAGMYLSVADYPREALARRESGTVEFDIHVSESGLPVRCVVTRSSGSAALDRHSCEVVMARLVFIPASDGSGGRSSGISRSRIRWVLP